MKNIILLKMKTNNILSYLSIAVLALFVASCVNDDDYATPSPSGTEDPVLTGQQTSFQAIYSRLAQANADGDATAIIEDDEDLYLVGYVVSSDQSGNFFEELIIQNKTDDSDSMDDPRLG
ncbi:MAG: hypothetical protein EX254_01915, partial [Flavobacteriaceae bacterium]